MDVLNKLLTVATPVPYDREAPVVDELKRLGYIELRSLSDSFDGDTTRTSRARLRYLAALMPDLDRLKLSTAITYIVGNPNLTEADVRLILDGRSLADPSRRTREIPVEAIQTVGRMLMAGTPHTEIARATRVSINSVEAIDEFLGLSTVRHTRLMFNACEALREGTTVRAFAKEAEISKSQAHRLLQKARAILVELGEVSE